MKHTRTSDKVISEMIVAMISGATIDDLVKLCGSKATAYRYLNVLEDVYDVGIINNSGTYKITSVGNDSAWRMVFNEVL